MNTSSCSSGRAQDEKDIRDGSASSSAAPSAEQRVAVLKAGWMFVGKAFQDGSEHCNEECPFYRSIAEVHPYGMGTATEYLCDCTLGQRVGDKFDSCPAWQAEQEESQEAA